MSMR
jgi:hypothetical protein